MTKPDPRPSLQRRAVTRLAPPIARLLEDRDRLRARQARLEKQLARQRRRTREAQQRVATLESMHEIGTADGADADRSLSYLFIVSYGRSGSTLLQGVLNAIPGYLIRGENRSAPYRLYQFHQAVTAAANRFARDEPLTSRDSWYGIDGYRSGEALVRMRELLLGSLLRPEDGTRAVGFKEIRWFQDDWRGYLRFLQDVFPGARFVINTRNHDGVVKSHWWNKMERDAAYAQLVEHEKQLDEMAGLLGDRAFRVHYDDYVADRSRLAELFAWLGEPFDRDVIDAVMDVRHSF